MADALGVHSAPGAARRQESTIGIYRRQIFALCDKNLKLFLRRPWMMLFRVFLVPIVLTLLVSLFKNVGGSIGGFADDNGGISDARPIKSVAQALENQDSTKFVFARNGQGNQVDQIIDRFTAMTGASNVVRVDNQVDILNECRMTLAGASDCFASIIFNKANGTFVDYIIAFNPADFEGETDWKSHKSTMQDRILPIQLAMDSAIADLPKGTVVNERSFSENSGYVSSYLSSQLSGGSEKKTSSGEVAVPNTNTYYYFLFFLLAPFFFMIFIEMVFHVCGFLTRERESGVTELLATQGCRQTPQIVSYFVSFWLLYLPTWIITGIILGVVLFGHTNAGFLVLFQVLAGTATLCMCVFLSTLFTKGHFSSPVSGIITLALAMINLNYLLKSNPSSGEIAGLAAVFPPFTYGSLIADIARLEGSASLGFSVSRSQADIALLTEFPSIAPYLYIIFFLIQIPLYLGLAVGSHFFIWHVPYIVTRLAPETGLAMRITGLDKTYKKSKGKSVDSLSMQVQRGQVACLLGPNGGGKTTTLKCIGGVVKADKGSSVELGCDRTELGYCPQHNVIWPQLTVREHVEIWLAVKGEKMSKAQSNAAVEEMVRECDLIEKIDGRASTLSGGQKRKLQLAIAFVGGSKIICIDEASSGVDPLSRQNIWQIIQQGLSHRTILLTTHFLDEADVLSDHVVIMSKGKLVVEGSSTALKAQYGDGYAIYNDQTLTNKLGHAKTSADVFQKLEELARGNPENSHKYEVGFPTLEQVFLRVANGESLGEESEDSDSGDEVANTTQGHPSQLLDKGRPISKFRQIWVLFKKRYSVLPHNWLAIIVTLAIPIAVSVACMKGSPDIGDWQVTGLHNCQYKIDEFQDTTKEIQSSAALSRSAAATATTKPSATEVNIFDSFSDGSLANYPPFYEALETASPDSSYSSFARIVVGPESVFRPGSEGYQILNDVFPDTMRVGSKALGIAGSLLYANDLNNYTMTLPESTNNVYSKRNGIYAPKGEDPQIALSTLFGQTSLLDAYLAYDSLSTVDNMLSKNKNGPTIRTAVREMRRRPGSYDFLATPFSLFLTMAVLAAFTASIIYPTYERIQKTRSLQYSNGVSPVSLWSAYLLFEFQLILVVAIVMFAILSIGPYTKLFYGLGYCFGAIILTGIATVLGCFILSLYFSSKLAYVMAAVIHLVLLLLYFVGVVLVATYSPHLTRYEAHNQLAAGLGLTSPAANLARAFLLASNSYIFLCGKYGEVAEPENPFAFALFGGVYFNLILQIIFLCLLLMAIEYSAFSRLYYRLRRPAHLKARNSMELELTAASRKSDTGVIIEKDKPLLECFGLHKSFNGTEAVHDVTLSVSSNETMALLGPNGAGKSTTINMIRGQFKPDSGDILVRNKSVLNQLVEARAETGVCPQEDATDDLTVIKTLRFYAEVRGVPDPERNAQLVMEALGIQEFKNKRVSKLSGGTKRKLSVAIALLGNPPVLLLDEPSTGLDAVSKRTLWKTLKALGKDRATLLTTHSMEEVEALATTVSIIAVRLLASGTTASLREQYGGFWHVRAIVNQESARIVEGMIRKAFGASVEDFATHGGSGQIRFGIRKGEELTFASAMREMERMKNNGVIVEYSINGTTLQEVFLNVCGKEKFSR
ncbi:hypothetical protein ABW20_dc0101824 [Dactylellina cionopaga]|nr:hypothetical protein ABW20_dc0101824 [Dactylellina cionopaga]